jgi:anti-anti-sigma regulatory factor
MGDDGHQEAVPAGIDVAAMPAEVMYANAIQVSSAVIAALACGTATVVADFTGTQSCDSAGIQAKLIAQRLADANDIALGLVMPDAVSQVFGLAGVGQVLTIYPTLSEALAATPHPRLGPGR